MAAISQETPLIFIKITFYSYDPNLLPKMLKPVSYTIHAHVSIQDSKGMHVVISRMTSIFQHTLYVFLKIVHLITLRADILLFMKERRKYDVTIFFRKKRNWTEVIEKFKMFHLICINKYNQNFEIIFNHSYDILHYGNVSVFVR